MAADLSTVTLSATKPIHCETVAMDATIDDVTEITLPVWARKALIIFQTGAGAATSGKISHTGTDGAAMGAEYFPIASGAAVEIPLIRNDRNISEGKPVIYLSCASSSGTAHLILSAV